VVSLDVHADRMEPATRANAATKRENRRSIDGSRRT
jgi:hypothetical protein